MRSGRLNRPARTLSHLALALVLVALVTVGARPTREPDLPPSPFDGKFSCSNGYFGSTLHLGRGLYEERFFSCTDSGTSSKGEYRIEGKTLTLLDSESGRSRHLMILGDRLLEKEAETYLDYARTRYADGRETVGSVSEGAISLPPLNAETLKHGREVFARDCTSCHGPSGKVDTQNGRKLGIPVLSQIDHTKHPLDLYALVALRRRTLDCSFKGKRALKLDDLWPVAYYVFTLSGREPVLP